MGLGASRARREAAFDRVALWAMAPRRPAFVWAFCVGAFAAATILRFALDSVLPPGFPFLTYFPAVALTAFLVGTRVGGAMALACLLASWYLFIPSEGSFTLSGASAVALALYVIVTATELALVDLMRRGLTRAERAEARARDQAEARALMFAELQHRVSNNLAVVGSLLAMQRRQVADPTAGRALDEAAARIAVVARLSRLLHDPEAQEIDFGAFLGAMVPDAVAASGAEGRLTVAVQAERVVVPAAKAVPLGLIATELLSNAIEHGFPDDRSGRIDVALSAVGADHARLVVRDDGVGLPASFDLDGARSLGLLIARQFAGQLGARLAIKGGGGATARLDFPLGDEVAARAGPNLGCAAASLEGPGPGP